MGVVAASTESESRILDRAVAEYEAFSAGTLDVLYAVTPAPGGVVECCGSEDDEAHWTAAYVRSTDHAVLPLVVGRADHVFARWRYLDRSATPIWDPGISCTEPMVRAFGVRAHPH